MMCPWRKFTLFVEKRFIAINFGWDKSFQGIRGKSLVEKYDKQHRDFLSKHWKNPIVCYIYYLSLLKFLKRKGVTSYPIPYTLFRNSPSKYSVSRMNCD